jgi:dihydrofolate reductase
MFGPQRGPWTDMAWKGWWGDSPPYHVPVFILTRHGRPSIAMEGGTTFHFVTSGIREALDRARAAAGGLDVRIGGGAQTIQQYLREGLIDELHLAIAPIVLGSGASLFQGIDLCALGYTCAEFAAGELATHVLLRRQKEAAKDQWLRSSACAGRPGAGSTVAGLSWLKPGSSLPRWRNVGWGQWRNPRWPDWPNSVGFAAVTDTAPPPLPTGAGAEQASAGSSRSQTTTPQWPPRAQS